MPIQLSAARRPRIAGNRAPREVFLRNLFINPFWEDSIEDLVNLMSPEHILFGSDYPHPEGMADPLHWAKEMGDLFPAADVRKMMGGNMFDLLGLTPPSH